MDSFYDQPRSVPQPVSSEKFFSAPIVPEVSMIFQNKFVDKNLQPRAVISSENLSYNAWKVKNQMPHAPSQNHLPPLTSGMVNKENVDTYPLRRVCHSPQIFSRKQVRFESPTMQNRAGNLPQNVYEKGREKYLPQQPLPSSTLISKPFEQIYMENIPNRHLDLSIIDVPRFKSAEKANGELGVVPHNHRINNLAVANKNEQASQGLLHRKVTENNKEDSFFEPCVRTPNMFDVAPRRRNCTQNEVSRFYNARAYTRSIPEAPHSKEQFYAPKTPNNNLDAENQDGPTVKDLLKIIQQQNEQLLVLQKQVSGLLDSRDHLRQIEPPNPPAAIYELKNAQHETMSVFSKTPEKGQGSKFAIDVMTSFEVSIRPQHNMPRSKFIKDYMSNEPKIQEILENNSENASNCKIADESNSKVDCSLMINEPINIPEECPSPEHSIHVDMQDYSSDSDDDCSPDLGWTIYNNVMGQVNNILKKPQNNAESKSGSSSKDAFAQNVYKIKDKTMRKVQDATLKHLKSIGVNIDNIPTINMTDSSINDSSSQEYSPTEISFAVKQLLMKYLPNEELAKITEGKQRSDTINNDPCFNAIKGRPEFSFATVQYMRKYNLMGSGNDKAKKTKPQQQERVHQQQAGGPKFLDITALKQQPKLL